MTTSAETAQQRPEIANPDMYGTNVAFLVITILSLVGVVISFFIKNKKLSEDGLQEKRVGNVSVDKQ